MFGDIENQWSRGMPLRHFTEGELAHLTRCGTITGEWCERMIACYRHLKARVTLLESELAEAGVALAKKD